MNRTDRLPLANFAVAFTAFAIASAMAMMQALSRASLDLPFRSARMYYLSVTAHGVLMALVFTTFFIVGFGYVVATRTLNRPIASPRLAWTGFWIALVGTALAAGAILSRPRHRAVHVLSAAPSASRVLHRRGAARRGQLVLVLSMIAVLPGVAPGASRRARAACHARHADRRRSCGSSPRSVSQSRTWCCSFRGRSESPRPWIPCWPGCCSGISATRSSTSGCCRRTSCGTRSSRRWQAGNCSAIRWAGSFSSCSCCSRPPSVSTTSSWIRRFLRRGNSCIR